MVKSKFRNQCYVLLKIGSEQIRVQAHNPRPIWFLIVEKWSPDFDEGVANSNVSRSDHPLQELLGANDYSDPDQPSSSWLQESLGADDYSDPDGEVNGKEIITTTLVAYSISILNWKITMTVLITNTVMIKKDNKLTRQPDMEFVNKISWPQFLSQKNRKKKLFRDQSWWIRWWGWYHNSPDDKMTTGNKCPEAHVVIPSDESNYRADDDDGEDKHGDGQIWLQWWWWGVVTL